MTWDMSTFPSLTEVDQAVTESLAATTEQTTNQPGAADSDWATRSIAKPLQSNVNILRR